MLIFYYKRYWSLGAIGVKKSPDAKKLFKIYG